MEGEQCWISASIDRLNREIAVQSDDAQERRRCEEQVRAIWSAHHMFSTIKLDVSLLRSSEDILKSLIRPDED